MVRLQHISTVDVTPSKWTIEGVMSGFSLLWGGPGVGKTFVAISMGASVATGRPWIGRKTVQGPVYYIVGEGGVQNVANRVRAALSEWTVDDAIDNVPFYLISPGINFVDGAFPFAELIGHPETLERRPRLVIVDTLSRNFVGDENKQEDMGKFVKSLDYLREGYACDVLVIHHANKEEELRGSSVLFGAVDVSWRLNRGRHQAPEDKILIMDADKLKERDSVGAKITMRGVKQVLYDDEGNPFYDEFGDKQTTLIIKPNKADLDRAKLMQVFALTEIAKRGMITYDEWRAGESFGSLRKDQFNAALTFILTYPGQWGIMRGPSVGTFIKARKDVENVW